MNRRGFLGAILATGCAPAVCKAEWLMKGRVLVPDTPAWLIGVPTNEWGNEIWNAGAPYWASPNDSYVKKWMTLPYFTTWQDYAAKHNIGGGLITARAVVRRRNGNA